MAPRFFGRYEHSLDAKGRVILPARLRSSFDTQAYLSQHHEKCLALWTPDEFDKQFTAMEANQDRSSEDRALARVWAAGLTEVELDKQGRVAIPAYLRRYAGLETGVLVVGALNRVELWHPDEWVARVQPAELRWSNGEGSPVGGAPSASPESQV